MKLRTLLVAALAAVTLGANAQDGTPKYEFNPYWTIGVQGGVGYSHGEHLKFSKVLSPAAALSVGYRFSRPIGLRLHASGWEAKNGWDWERTANHPDYYKWNYGQLGLDAVLDLNTIFGSYNPNRCFTINGILGVGYIHGFKNKEAIDIHNANKFELLKTWNSNTLNMVAARGGVQLDFRLAKRVSFNVEGLATLTSDKFNSKDGGNPDWNVNVFGGFTFRLGHINTEPIETVVPIVAAPVVEEVKEEVVEPAPAPAPAPAPEPAPVKVQPMTRNVFFLINSAKVRPSEMVKVNEVVAFLNANPNAKVAITGYADRGTGNTVINARISKQRANAVFAELVKQKIAADRIIKDAKGDTVQPFAENDLNRAVICIAE